MSRYVQSITIRDQIPRGLSNSPDFAVPRLSPPDHKLYGVWIGFLRRIPLQRIHVYYVLKYLLKPYTTRTIKRIWYKETSTLSIVERQCGHIHTNNYYLFVPSFSLLFDSLSFPVFPSFIGSQTTL